MNFKTHNDKAINAVGTSYQGRVIINYFALKRLFGKPHDGDQYKADAEWEIEFEDGVVATIYNYKNGISYLGRTHGIPKSRIVEWHVGGHTREAFERVNAIIAANMGGL